MQLQLRWYYEDTDNKITSKTTVTSSSNHTLKAKWVKQSDRYYLCEQSDGTTLNNGNNSTCVSTTTSLDKSYYACLDGYTPTTTSNTSFKCTKTYTTTNVTYPTKGATKSIEYTCPSGGEVDGSSCTYDAAPIYDEVDAIPKTEYVPTCKDSSDTKSGSTCSYDATPVYESYLASAKIGYSCNNDIKATSDGKCEYTGTIDVTISPSIPAYVCPSGYTPDGIYTTSITCSTTYSYQQSYTYYASEKTCACSANYSSCTVNKTCTRTRVYCTVNGTAQSANKYCYSTNTSCISSYASTCKTIYASQIKAGKTVGTTVKESVSVTDSNCGTYTNEKCKISSYNYCTNGSICGYSCNGVDSSSSTCTGYKPATGTSTRTSDGTTGYLCPDGYEPSYVTTSAHECTATTPSCPLGGSLKADGVTCSYDATPYTYYVPESCGSGYTFDNDTGLCVPINPTSYTCSRSYGTPSGTSCIYDADQVSNSYYDSTSCKDGYTWEEGTAKCKSNNPTSYTCTKSTDEVVGSKCSYDATGTTWYTCDSGYTPKEKNTTTPICTRIDPEYLCNTGDTGGGSSNTCYNKVDSSKVYKYVCDDGYTPTASSTTSHTCTKKTTSTNVKYSCDNGTTPISYDAFDYKHACIYSSIN